MEALSLRSGQDCNVRLVPFDCFVPAALSVRSCFEPNPEAGKATGKHTKALSTLDLLAHRKMCLSGPCACLTYVLNLEAAEKARVPRKAVGMRASWSATNICSPEPCMDQAQRRQYCLGFRAWSPEAGCQMLASWSCLPLRLHDTGGQKSRTRCSIRGVRRTCSAVVGIGMCSQVPCPRVCRGHASEWSAYFRC